MRCSNCRRSLARDRFGKLGTGLNKQCKRCRNIKKKISLVKMQILRYTLKLEKLLEDYNNLAV